MEITQGTPPSRPLVHKPDPYAADARRLKGSRREAPKRHLPKDDIEPPIDHVMYMIEGSKVIRLEVLGALPKRDIHRQCRPLEYTYGLTPNGFQPETFDWEAYHGNRERDRRTLATVAMSDAPKYPAAIALRYAPGHELHGTRLR